MASRAVRRCAAALELVIGGERRAERAAGIAGRRLNPDVVELAVAQHLAVGHAVERDAAGEAQILRAGLGRRALRVSRSTTSSDTAWIEAATSMWNWRQQLVGRARAARRTARRTARWSWCRPVQ